MHLGEAVEVATAMRAAGLAPTDAMAVVRILHEAKIGVSEMPDYLKRLGGLKAANVDLLKRLERARAELKEAEARRDRAVAEVEGAWRNRDRLSAEVTGAVRIATEAATAAAGAATDQLQQVAAQAVRALAPVVHLVEVRQALEREISAMRGEIEGLGVVLASAREVRRETQKLADLRAGRTPA